MAGKINVEELVSYSDDLVSVLKSKTDMKALTHCLHHSNSLLSSARSDFHQSLTLLHEYEGKIDECERKTERARLEVDSQAGELVALQNELESQLRNERVLNEQLRVISNEVNDLERQRVSFEGRKRDLKRLERDELRAQRKLSMYASVTNIIPNLDHQSKVSGHIVDRDKKVVEKFEFDPTKISQIDTCQSIWRMISK